METDTNPFNAYFILTDFSNECVRSLRLCVCVCVVHAEIPQEWKIKRYFFYSNTINLELSI